MRFHNLQVLRVLAAVAVLGYHLDHYGRSLFGVPAESTGMFALWGGVGFAVPLFFALSGFVLTHALQATPPGRFFLARALRLYPGYWLALATAAVLISDGSLLADLRTIARRMTKAELFLWPAGPAPARMYLLGIEWSLFYEVELSFSLAVLALLGLRRRLLPAAVVWLALIGAKIALRPGYAADLIPHWRTVWLSAFNVPFLLGVVAYSLKDVGRSWRWAAPLVIATAAGLCVTRVDDGEQNWCLWGVVGATTVWLAAQLPQLPAGHRLVRLGDCTYGLFLIHVPVILAVGRWAKAHDGWHGTIAGLLAAAAAALAAGLLFGRVESGLHARLRLLTKRPPGEAWGRSKWPGWRLFPRRRLGRAVGEHPQD